MLLAAFRLPRKPRRGSLRRMEALALRPFRPADAGWVIDRHAQLYAREAGFDARFRAAVTEAMELILAGGDRTAGWIAESPGGRRLGSVFCTIESAETARLRLFLLEPEARGQGAGRRMLEAAIAHARAAGASRLMLWTHESHRAACALYAARGFVLTEARPVRNYGRDLVEQRWEIAL